MTTATKTRTMRLTDDGKALVITQEDHLGRQVDAYFLAIEHDDPAHRVLKLSKHDGTVYRVVVANKPQFDECDCKGNRRWGHCKHKSACRKLVELGRL